MIRIYYNIKTGEIVRTVADCFAANELSHPYILHDTQIRLDSWRVNPETRELEKI